jgi:hypothetical protein
MLNGLAKNSAGPGQCSTADYRPVSLNVLAPPLKRSAPAKRVKPTRAGQRHFDSTSRAQLAVAAAGVLFTSTSQQHHWGSSTQLLERFPRCSAIRMT